MKKNIGMADKGIRLLAAMVVASLFFTGLVSGPLAIILLSLAGILLITSFVSFCPLYSFFGFSTLDKSHLHETSN